MHKILLIDDDKGLTDLLADYLEQNNYNVTVAHRPIKGIDLVEKNAFDLVLLDVMMPEMDGFEVLRELRNFSKVPVIMLTARGDDYDKVLGLELGADDYVAKPFNHRELLARIKALIRRLDPDGILSEKEEFQLHGIYINVGSQKVTVNQQDVELTGTEFVMLTALMKSPGRLLSKQVLSEAVLGKKLEPFDRSLDMHISNVRKKLSANGVDDVIKTVRGSGYMMVSAS